MDSNTNKSITYVIERESSLVVLDFFCCLSLSLSHILTHSHTHSLSLFNTHTHNYTDDSTAFTHWVISVAISFWATFLSRTSFSPDSALMTLTTSCVFPKYMCSIEFLSRSSMSSTIRPMFTMCGVSLVTGSSCVVCVCVSEWMNECVCECVSEWKNECVCVSVSEWKNECVCEWMNECVSEWMNEWMNE